MIAELLVALGLLVSSRDCTLKVYAILLCLYSFVLQLILQFVVVHLSYNNSLSLLSVSNVTYIYIYIRDIMPL